MIIQRTQVEVCGRACAASNRYCYSGGWGLGGLGRDKYADFKELAGNETQCVDWRPGMDCGYSIGTSMPESGSSCLVMAIHAGNIEENTEKLVPKFEGECNTYVFKGASWDLHITSTHFDEPKLMALIDASSTCVSLHGMRLATEKLVRCDSKLSVGLLFHTGAY